MTLLEYTIPLFAALTSAASLSGGYLVGRHAKKTKETTDDVELNGALLRSVQQTQTVLGNVLVELATVRVDLAECVAARGRFEVELIAMKAQMAALRAQIAGTGK